VVATSLIAPLAIVPQAEAQMTVNDLHSVQNTLIGFTKRAEKATEESLVSTFVDSAPLFSLLSTENNQVIYGRRGTGKTHALKVLAEHVEKRGGIPVFLDMRTIGSNGSIYADSSRPLAERASVLLSDALAGMLTEFYTIAVGLIDDHPHPEQVTQRLDALQESISTVKVIGDVINDTTSSKTQKDENSINVSADFAKLTGTVGAGVQSVEENTNYYGIRRAGRETIHLTFGSIAGAIADMATILGGKRIWFLIDEWSEIPVDLQPYIADLFRRVILPVNEITLKIAAIEHRTDFAILKERGEYIGLELGADVSADLNLDDFLVFDNDQARAVEFIASLIYRHYKSSPSEHPEFDSPDELISSLFTQRPVFEEFVRAVEGVPRDALNLMAKVVTKAYGQQISMNHVRAGARDWYNQDKSAVIRNDTDLADLLQYIVAEVIGSRRARAFLLSSNTTCSKA
jgi:hypothetical protein